MGQSAERDPSFPTRRTVYKVVSYLPASDMARSVPREKRDGSAKSRKLLFMVDRAVCCAALWHSAVMQTPPERRVVEVRTGFGQAIQSSLVAQRSECWWPRPHVAWCMTSTIRV